MIFDFCFFADRLIQSHLLFTVMNIFLHKLVLNHPFIDYKQLQIIKHKKSLSILLLLAMKKGRGELRDFLLVLRMPRGRI